MNPLLILLFSLLLIGCGQTGPLELPQKVDKPSEQAQAKKTSL